VTSVSVSGTNCYRACPDYRAFAPGRAFADAEAALDYARGCADRFRVGYVVWQFHGTAWRIIARVEPAKGVRP
jgi:hypothetical protein